MAITRRYRRRGVPTMRRKKRRVSRARTVRRKRVYGRVKRMINKVVVKPRTVSHDLIITNEQQGQRVVVARVSPWMGGTNVSTPKDIIMKNVWADTFIPYMTDVEKEQYATLFKYAYVKRWWFKYTPGITQGTVGHSTGTAGTITDFKGGGVHGMITCMWSNNPDEDIADHPVSSDGVVGFKSNRRATTFNMYKPFFKSFVPKIKIDQADGNLSMTKYIPYKIEVDTDNVIAYPAMLMMANMPREVGFEYNPSQIVDKYFPIGGNSVIIGSIEIGATIEFSGLRV